MTTRFMASLFCWRMCLVFRSRFDGVKGVINSEGLS